jgi:PEGA domain-containing protein
MPCTPPAQPSGNWPAPPSYAPCFPLAARPNKLVITSAPSGAAVQINGVFVGPTPYQKDIPGGYLHKTKTSLGSRLEHPMIARLTLDGYAAKEIQLTEGPTNWVSLKGHNYGGYWLLKTDHFHVEAAIHLANLHGRGGKRGLVYRSTAPGAFARRIGQPYRARGGVPEKPNQKRHRFFRHRNRSHRHQRPSGARRRSITRNAAERHTTGSQNCLRRSRSGYRARKNPRPGFPTSGAR